MGVFLRGECGGEVILDSLFDGDLTFVCLLMRMCEREVADWMRFDGF